ncbi:ABC transporter permease [Rhodanobacter sp. 115]|uniref:ABC transporter permease n=1 Tax=Rhodanobacter sp. FW021-MT20 TaxID=1162282 RepID=UPI000260FD07|nr:ABC transporter permease [Rhodanobacter sp. 115]EIL87409.1 O-antigen export system permease [Rhodanobacter sp. 115]
MSLSLTRSLWQYRGFILGNVRREFEARYRNSLLGAAWTVLQPLAMITVYTVVFSELMRARVAGLTGPYAYSIYLCSGLLTWGLFGEILQRGQTVFLDHGNMIKKLSFPRICLPAITVLNALVNFAITFSIFLVFLLLLHSFPGWVVLWAIPLLIVQVAFAIGVGMIAGVLNVFFRDVGQFVNILLQFWFWFTPIVYSAATLSPTARTIIQLNPMTPLAEGYQAIFAYGRAPAWHGTWPVAILAVALCVFALLLFRRRSAEMVDEL